MHKKLIILLISAALFLVAVFIPQPQEETSAVMHQHKSWPAETKKAVGLDQNGVLTSHLPIVILHTDGRTVPGMTEHDERDLYCDYSIIHNKDGVNCSEDEPEQSGKMAVAIRGNSSRTYPKKQYGMKLRDEYNRPEKKSLLGMPEETTWVLNGSYIDHAMIRNYMLYNISAEIMKYVPECRLCEVMTTDQNGKTEYQGVYTLIEKIGVGKTRMDLSEYDPAYEETSFLLQMNSHIDSREVEHLKPDDISAYTFDLEYPDHTEITEKSYEYVEDELKKFEKALYDADYTGDWDKIEEYMDMGSFVDYYLINEFFQNYDAGMRSTYLYKNLGGKFYIGPVWDFDGTFDNFRMHHIRPDSMGLKTSFYYYYLTQNPEFIQRCAKRYKELRETFFSDKYLLQYIEDCGQYLKGPAERNCDRWYKGDDSVYRDDVEKMKRFILVRGKWMDEYFGQMSRVID